MFYKAALCALNAKYIHSSLAPWCLLAGVQTYAADCVQACVVEGTINEPPDAVLARILMQQPQAVTFTCYLWNISATLALALQLKKQNPALVIALGGPEVSYNAADVLAQHAHIDYILAGEGEQSVPAFLRCLALGQPPVADGLCTRQACAPPCILQQEVPSPYTPEYLAQLHGRIAYLETSRGCPYSCAFCLSGRCGKPRYFALEQAKQNILTLAVSGTQTVKFIDRTFNANPAHANAILRFLLEHYGKEIPKGVCFHFEIAGDILTEETFSLLAQAPVGAFQLEIGMQSFHAETLCAIRRKTDVEKLQHNIRRLVAMHNMHVHIDLIAGLPHEDLATFGQSFDIGYALGAHMLQLGFLKLLHGAAMREEPEVFPCRFSAQPPYEVINTPWLSTQDLQVLSGAEDALERMYNSGRFLLTAAYVLQVSGLSPFALYCLLGEKAKALGTHHVPLDDYTAFLYAACAALPGVAPNALRDCMVQDRLATNATGRLPLCLQVKDAALAKAVKALAAHEDSAPKPGVRRGVALLYGQKKVCFVDYTQKNALTGRYLLHAYAIDNLFAE